MGDAITTNPNASTPAEFTNMPPGEEELPNVGDVPFERPE